MPRHGARLLLFAVLGAGSIGALRQQREAAAVAAGELPRLGPAGSLHDTASGLHAQLSSWSPSPPSAGLARRTTMLWASPLTALGLLAAAAGGARPSWDAAAGCWLATGVGGPTGAFLRRQGAAAATLGHVVVSRSPVIGPTLLRHEVEHVRQMERLGPTYAVLYPVAQATWGYRRNPFEVAARRAAAALSAPSGTT